MYGGPVQGILGYGGGGVLWSGGSDALSGGSGQARPGLVESRYCRELMESKFDQVRAGER